MAIIQMTKAEAAVFQRWIAYFGRSTPETRTKAFFAAIRGHVPPSAQKGPER